MSQSLSIGLIAYGLDEHRVFVRVPNEKGRWMLAERCVIEVDCPYCGAITGEPCRAVRRRCEPHNPVRYHVGTHCDRRDEWHRKAGRRPSRREPPRKLHITAAEMAELQRDPHDDFPPITPKE